MTIPIGFKADQDCANKLLRIAKHIGSINGGLSEGVRASIDIAYEKLKPEMTSAVRACVYTPKKRTPLKKKKK